jgi:hypothetical protein
VADEWYYTRQGQQQGPVGAAQLKQLAASGQLLPTDLVWKEGLANWVPASSARGLFPPAAAPASGRARPAPAGPVPPSGRIQPAAAAAPASGRVGQPAGLKVPVHVSPIDDEEDYEEVPEERPRRKSKGLGTGAWVAIIGGSVGGLVLIGGVILLIVLLGRGSPTGPRTFVDNVPLGRRSYNVTFRGGQLAQFSIVGQGNCDVEIYVFDRTNQLVTSNMAGRSDRRSVSWPVPVTQTYRIELNNNGPVADRVTITHN